MTGLVVAAETASRADEFGTWAVVILLVTVVYLASAWFWPWQACPRCKGAGKFKSPTGKAWRLCPRCKGKGGRVRRLSRYMHRD